MGRLTLYTAKPLGVPSLTADENRRESARRPPCAKKPSFVVLSSQLIGNEVPQSFSLPEHPPQQQNVRQRLLDYGQQIEQLRLTLDELHTSLHTLAEELQEHPAEPPPGHVSKKLSDVIIKANDSATLVKTSESIQLTSTLLRRIFPDLTRSELMVAAYIACGFVTTHIATLYAMSHRTVENHRQHIRKKLGISGKQNLAAYLQTSLRTLN